MLTNCTKIAEMADMGLSHIMFRPDGIADVIIKEILTEKHYSLQEKKKDGTEIWAHERVTV